MTSRAAHRRLTARAVVVLMVAAVAAGCATIPTTSTPNVGSAPQTEGAVPFVRVIARPPQPGASPTEVVSGFLDASADFEDNWAIARTYLAPNVAEQWQPNTGVSVYDAGTSFALTQETAKNTASSASSCVRPTSRPSVVLVPTDLRRSVRRPRWSSRWGASTGSGGSRRRRPVSCSPRSTQLATSRRSTSTSLTTPSLCSFPTRCSCRRRTRDLSWRARAQSCLRGPSAALAPAVSTGIPGWNRVGHV